MHYCDIPDDMIHQFWRNICDVSRNKSFIHIVHEKSKGKVFGITDDLIIRIDERKRKSSSIPIDKKEASELHELIKNAPAADPQKCKYGYQTLPRLLPSIIEKHQISCQEVQQ